jgi:phosphonate degradation associated HDIG domain protein
MNTITQAVEEIFSLYEKFGDEDYIGEPVSQLEHMSQSAQLALQEGFEDEVVLAAFFHDIGHLCEPRSNEDSMGEFGIKSHEKIGADYLREKGFPEQVARLVENHVAAKRYLTFKYSQYYAQLSEASKKTLEYQGGKMTSAEAKEFEKDTLFELSILLRRWDELAKATGVPVLNLDILKAKAVSVLQNHSINL